MHGPRNVAEHLAQHRRAWVRAAIRKARVAETVKEARQKLTHLAEQLDHEHPGAAGSIREGSEETLTLIQLGVTGALHRMLCSTNIIENLIGSVKVVARNVKRWHGSQMLELIAALDAVCAANSVDKKDKAAGR